MKRLLFILFILTNVNCFIWSEEQQLDLDKIEIELKKKPDDPTLHYKKCQALFSKGKEQEAVDYASIALEKFIKAKVDLAWLHLGTIKTGKFKIDVHFNMGPKERAEKKVGIVRPLSFRVWTIEEKPKLVRIIDFELAFFDNKLVSAAIGEMQDGSHINFGVLDEKSKFEIIKKKVIDIVAK